MNILFTLIIKHLIRNMDYKNDSIDTIVDALKNKASTIVNSIITVEEIGYFPSMNVKLSVTNILIQAYSNVILFSESQMNNFDICLNKLLENDSN